MTVMHRPAGTVRRGALSQLYQRVPVPLAQLRNLGQLLVNVHGQHAHQMLLKPDYQLALLDGYAGHHLLLDDVRRHYQQWRQLQNELNRLKAEQQQRKPAVNSSNTRCRSWTNLPFSRESLKRLKRSISGSPMAPS
jgi:DNA repair protein RecN (Recombination protein N)